VIEVPDGYALNNLIPKRLAEPATSANLKRIAQSKAGIQAQVDSKAEAFSYALTQLNLSPLQISADSNELGHLFKAIHEADVIGAAKERGVALDTHNVLIETSIKSLGEHAITLREGTAKVTYTIEVIKKP
jgi:large subunit ribosomal protein L9